MFDPVVDEADLTDLVLDRPHWAEREPPEIDPEIEDEEAPHVLHPPAPGTPVIDPDSPPGARLALDIEYATALATQLTDTQLLEVVAATARHRNWLAALEHRVIALYADRHPRSGEAVRPGAAAATPVQQWLPDELGLVLAVSRERARGIIADAQRLAHVLPATLDALQSGRLDRCKVDTVLRATDVLDDEQARQVEAIVLANAAGATRRQIYDRLRRAVAKVDPDGARRRHLRSLDDRRIGLAHGDDGMATLWLTGSAPDAQASWRSLDRLARSLARPTPTPPATTARPGAVPANPPTSPPVRPGSRITCSPKRSPERWPRSPTRTMRSAANHSSRSWSPSTPSSAPASAPPNSRGTAPSPPPPPAHSLPVGSGSNSSPTPRPAGSGTWGAPCTHRPLPWPTTSEPATGAAVARPVITPCGTSTTTSPGHEAVRPARTTCTVTVAAATP